ncbi:MAG: SpoIIE family protein phosphatase [Proteobacteria bacterium]|nr:SpoIIE family protein phosphatase [Pseudomonadota bacterium]
MKDEKNFFEKLSPWKAALSVGAISTFLSSGSAYILEGRIHILSIILPLFLATSITYITVRMGRNYSLFIEHKNQIISAAHLEIKEKNEQIKASIEYAKQIQHSLLPRTDEIEKHLPNSFIIWRPRDVVGGDLYFAYFKIDIFVIAVLDCTGHGVPGALMTMAASSALNRIIIDEGCIDPASILKQLNVFIKTALKQDTEYSTSDDGLDASVCFVDKKKKILTFSGAKLPLVYTYNSELISVKGDRQSLGYKRSNLDFIFTNHRIKIEDNMCFYLFTDGIIDQLGGNKRLSFGKKRLYNLLSSISDLPFDSQYKAFLKTFQEFKGATEMIDDLTLLGFKITQN